MCHAQCSNFSFLLQYLSSNMHCVYILAMICRSKSTRYGGKPSFFFFLQKGKLLVIDQSISCLQHRHIYCMFYPKLWTLSFVLYSPPRAITHMVASNNMLMIAMADKTLLRINRDQPDQRNGMMFKSSYSIYVPGWPVAVVYVSCCAFRLLCIQTEFSWWISVFCVEGTKLMVGW